MIKTALITGASRGIGAATARLLAADGYCVAGTCCRSQAEMEELARTTGILPIRTDLSDPAQIPQLAQRALELLGHVDVLVNNAACSYIDLFQCMPPERIRELYAVNLTAVVELTRALLPSMLSRHSGCIINISSVWGDTDMTVHLPPETLAELAEETPLGRNGTPEDVAEAVRFLASDRAAFITGQDLPVNGGFLCV